MGIELSRELLVAARAKDRRALDRVGVWMTDTLLAFYRGQGRPVDEAEELSQKALEDLVKKLADAPEDPEQFRDHVECFATIAARRHRSDAQRHENKRAAAHVQPHTPARRPDSLLSVRRLLAWVRSELSKLPTPWRDTLGLTLERDNYREIADELEVSEETLRVRAWKARNALKKGRDKRFRT